MNTSNKKTNGHADSAVNVASLANKPTTRPPVKTLAEYGYSDYQIARVALELRKADGRLNFPVSHFFGDAVELLLAVKAMQTNNTPNEARTIARAGKEAFAGQLHYYGFDELTDKGGLMADLYKDAKELRSTVKRWAKDGQMADDTRALAKTLLKEGKASTLELLRLRMILENEYRRAAVVS